MVLHKVSFEDISTVDPSLSPFGKAAKRHALSPLLIFLLVNRDIAIYLWYWDTAISTWSKKYYGQVCRWPSVSNNYFLWCLFQRRYCKWHDLFQFPNRSVYTGYHDYLLGKISPKIDHVLFVVWGSSFPGNYITISSTIICSIVFP